jgi:hypothetical protein
MKQIQITKNHLRSLSKDFNLAILIFLILVSNFSCATLLPTEKRIYSEKIEYKKDAESWKKTITTWVTLRYGERGLASKIEEKDSLIFTLGMGYKPESILPTAGSCHFILHAGYSDKSLELTFENIFFVNGYGRVGTTSRMHDGESGPNNPKELETIINRCIKVAVNDLKDFVK